MHTPSTQEMSLLSLAWDGERELEKESKERAGEREWKQVVDKIRPIQGITVVIYVRLEPNFLAIVGSAPVCLSKPFSSHLMSADQNF